MRFMARRRVLRQDSAPAGGFLHSAVRPSCLRLLIRLSGRLSGRIPGVPKVSANAGLQTSIRQIRLLHRSLIRSLILRPLRVQPPAPLRRSCRRCGPRSCSPSGPVHAYRSWSWRRRSAPAAASSPRRFPRRAGSARGKVQPPGSCRIASSQTAGVFAPSGTKSKGAPVLLHGGQTRGLRTEGLRL